MSDDGSSSSSPPEPTPRRSGRDRNASAQNAANTSSSSAAPAATKKGAKPNKKAASPDPAEAEDSLEEVSTDPSSDDDDDSEEEFSLSLSKKKTPNKRASIGSAKGKGKGKAPQTSDDDQDDEDEDGTPKARKTRAPANKEGKAPAKPRGPGKGGRKKKAAAGGDGANAGEVEFQEGADVKRDNVFFNALLSGKAFDPIIEDWVEQYEEDEDQALGELVVFLLRSSGSSAAVTPAEAVDVDGIVSQCDDIEKEKSLGDYPLISKQKAFKRFHPALTSFLSSFLSNLSGTPHLYSSKTSKSEPSPIIHVFQSWLFSLCSSRLRSFRHTATVIALETMTALCEVAAEVRDELGTASRQREQERKKVAKGGAGEAAAKERLKELEKKVKEVHWKKGKLEGYLTEIFNTVFVMRYRDTEALIRTVCVKELGVWMKTLPDVYLESAYFKYVGWMLDDINSSTRLETVKALSTLYADQSNASSLSSFTERFKRRLLQMAFHDIELSVRTTAIGILNHVDRSGMLDDEKRRQVGLLVFDSEGRVRKAVAGFFEGRWEEERDEMLEEIESAERRKKKAGGARKKRTADDEDEEVLKARVGWKCLASMLVRFSHALDDASAPVDADETMDDPSAREAAEELKAWVEMAPKGRIGSAVESLWDKVEKLRDCDGLVDFLGLDHSADNADDDADAETDGWKLDDDEEGCLLQVLVAGLRKVKADAEKKDDPTVSQEMTRILIKALPKLIAKHQSDVPRLADILTIPHLMTLEMYLDLRMVTAFETLWDDLTKVFLKNSEPVVLGPAVTAMNYLMSSEALANTNAKKYAELEDALFTSLRAVVDGRDVETAGFSEDDVATLTSVCMRIGLLYNFRDLGLAMDEDEGGKQSSGWAILLALASRGSLGYKEEGKFVDHALETLNKYVLWRANADREDSSRRADLIDKRGALLEKLEEFAVGTQSNAVDIVRRTAFNLLLTLYVLFNSATDLIPTEKRDNVYVVPDELKLALDEQIQFRCSGFMQAEIEKYAEEKMDLSASQHEDGSDDDASDDEQAARKKKKLAAKKKTDEAGIAGPNEAALTAEHRFISTVGSYLIALRASVLDIEHSATILTHHGRFGLEYDALCKIFVEDLRSLACYGGSSGGAEAAKVVVESLKDSYALFTDGAITEAELVSLAKLLSSALVVHGAGFKITKRMDSRAMVAVHNDLLDWLAKKIAEAEKGSSKAKKMRNALTFFKSLVLLAAPLDGKESMKISNHLKDALAKYKIEISTTKIWDHERAYEKKLTTTMSKDPKIAKGARQQLADAADRSSPAPRDDDDARPSSPIAAATANPRPKRGRPAKVVGDSDDDDQPKDDDQPAAKKPRPKPKARTLQKEVEPEPEPEVEDDDDDEPEMPQNMDPVEYEDTTTKRPREEDEEAEPEVEMEVEEEPVVAVEEEQVQEVAEDGDEEDGAASPPSKPASSSSQESVVNTGRKKRPRRK